ncbi:MAG: murein DD-endopeptidase MepM/ murein hydrolase activator NlpD [Janthinobacterium sp.]|jgi:murein DD-endopeptidase MepM/ murein hydrolase activator NlpD
MNSTYKFTSSSLYKLLLSTRKARILSAGGLFLTACAFGAAGIAPTPDISDLEIKSIAEDLALPNLETQIAALQEASQTYINEEQIRSGDTLASLLRRLGVDDADAVSFIKSNKVAYGAMQLKSGKRVQAQTTEDGQLQWLRAPLLDNNSDVATDVFITRKGENFQASEMPAKLERRVEMHSREIVSSLYAATDTNTDGTRMPDAVASQIVDMFSTNIDFRSDLRRGDHFNVVYETFWQGGRMVSSGRILAGEFTNRGTTYQSVWFDDPDTKQGGAYYSFDGKSLKKAFLKSPLAYSRISSGFSMRMHPISGNWKRHKGVDFAAASGTPIRAAGDGTVATAAMSGGYGNLVVLKHWSNYSTAYAHMSRFAPGIKKGSKVSQGDVIGYVGSTGWSTGAHLHYEFRVNDVARDPMKVSLTVQAPLSSSEKARFHQVSNDMKHRFSLLRQNGTKLALR